MPAALEAQKVSFLRNGYDKAVPPDCATLRSLLQHAIPVRSIPFPDRFKA